jgi:predicted O-methyltransferase YrrM
MNIWTNLRPRLRLLQTALTKRFIYADVVEMATNYGNLPVTDVEGNLDPVDMLWRLSKIPSEHRLDFSALSPTNMLTGPADRQEWSSEKNAAEFIGRLTAVMNAQTVFEIGCFIGYTTTHVATALHARGDAGRTHIVDCEQSYLDTTMANLRRLGLDHLTTAHLGSACDPAVLEALPRKADLIFIDTTHTYDDTRAEIIAYKDRLNPGGCLALHDSVRFPGVRRAIREVNDVFDICTFATERGNGLSVLVPRDS